MAINANGEEKNPYFCALSLNELLDWYDVDFVRCAYVTLLGRQPDVEGEDHYVRSLRAGRSRLSILWELRRSKGGRLHDPGIAGLDRALRHAAWQRKTGIGWLWHLVCDLNDGNSSRDRQFRALMNTVMITRLELQQLSRSMPHFAVAMAPPVSIEELGRGSVAGHAQPHRKKIFLPELERLMPTSPLQQHFVTSVG